MWEMSSSVGRYVKCGDQSDGHSKKQRPESLRGGGGHGGTKGKENNTRNDSERKRGRREEKERELRESRRRVS